MSYVCIVLFIHVRFIRKIVLSLRICCAIKESTKMKNRCKSNKLYQITYMSQLLLRAFHSLINL